MDTKVVIPLGYGDNNKGEMGALAVGLERSLEALERRATGEEDGPASGHSIFFSDSALCVGHLEKGWTFPTWTNLARRARNALKRLRRRTKVTIYWIRGHVGIPGNERADAAAKEAARRARDDLAPGGRDINPEDRGEQEGVT